MFLFLLQNLILSTSSIKFENLILDVPIMTFYWVFQPVHAFFQEIAEKRNHIILCNNENAWTCKIMEDYGCITWTLTKRLEKKLDGNYTTMLRAILNKSWRQHLTRHQLYGHLSPVTKTIQVRRTRHIGHCWRSRDELLFI